MRKIAAALLMISFSLSGVAGAEDAVFEFDTIQEGAATDLLVYDVLYISAVDTSKVTPDIFDPLDDEEDAGDLRRKIGYRLRQDFEKRLRRVMPVTSSTAGIGEKRAAELKIALTGSYRDTSILENTIPGVSSRKVAVSMELTLLDHDSGETLLFASDSYEGRMDTKGDLELRLNDLDQWYSAIDFWASEFAKFLAFKRGTLMPVARTANQRAR